MLQEKYNKPRDCDGVCPRQQGKQPMYRGRQAQGRKHIQGMAMTSIPKHSTHTD